MNHNQNPGTKLVYPEPCKEFQRRNLWLGSLLTFINPRVLSTWLNLIQKFRLHHEHRMPSAKRSPAS